jgi:3-hydroxymyristoyl/3-hydroxydecanoyl-(acyl carrier protein) dehydratase
LSAEDSLPHTYPFRFVDRSVAQDGAEPGRARARVRVSSNARAAMGEAWFSPLLFVEAIAQSALLLQAGGAEKAGRGFLAGIDEFAFERAPEAGESLEIDVRLAGRFGAVAKFQGEVRSGDAAIARAGILVRSGT